MAYEALTTSIFAPYLKNMWHRGRVNDMAARKMAFWGWLNKTEDFFGEDQKVTIKYVNPQGRSKTFSKSQDNAKAGRAVRMSITRKSDYATCYLSSETIEAAANDKGAIYRALDPEIEGAMSNLLHSLQIDLPRNGGGTRGQLNAAPTVPGGGAYDYIVLKSARDSKNFEVNQVLKAGTTNGVSATTFRSTPSTATVVAIDRSRSDGTSRLYFAAGTFSGTNWTTNDYLNVEGDIDATSLTGKAVKGVDAWIPYTAPSAGESFNGVDRTTDVDRLAGLRKDCSLLSIENGIITLAQEISDAGGDPDTCWVSPRRWGELEISLGSKVRYDVVRGSGEMAQYGWRAITLSTDSGDIKVCADRGFSDTYFYLLKKETWRFHSLGQAPRAIKTDGNELLRVSNADDVEFRAVYRGDLICDAPGHNGVGNLGT